MNHNNHSPIFVSKCQLPQIFSCHCIVIKYFAFSNSGFICNISVITRISVHTKTQWRWIEVHLWWSNHWKIHQKHVRNSILVILDDWSSTWWSQSPVGVAKVHWGVVRPSLFWKSFKNIYKVAYVSPFQSFL